MNRLGLANSVAVAYLGASNAALPFQILGALANAREGENLVIVSEDCMAVDDDVRMQPASVSNDHVFSDDAERAYLATGSDLRFLVDAGGGVDRGSVHRSTSIKVTSASLTGSDAT